MNQKQPIHKQKTNSAYILNGHKKERKLKYFDSSFNNFNLFLQNSQEKDINSQNMLSATPRHQIIKTFKAGDIQIEKPNLSNRSLGKITTLKTAKMANFLPLRGSNNQIKSKYLNTNNMNKTNRVLNNNNDTARYSQKEFFNKKPKSYKDSSQNIQNRKISQINYEGTIKSKFQYSQRQIRFGKRIQTQNYNYKQNDSQQTNLDSHRLKLQTNAMNSFKSLFQQQNQSNKGVEQQHSKYLMRILESNKIRNKYSLIKQCTIEYNTIYTDDIRKQSIQLLPASPIYQQSILLLPTSPIQQKQANLLEQSSNFQNNDTKQLLIDFQGDDLNITKQINIDEEIVQNQIGKQIQTKITKDTKEKDKESDDEIQEVNFYINKCPPDQQVKPTVNQPIVNPSKPTSLPAPTLSLPLKSLQSQHIRQQLDQSEQNTVVEELNYLMSLVECLGSFYAVSKQFYSNDSEMKEIARNNKIGAYYIAHQFYYYQNVYLNHFNGQNKGCFYTLDEQQLKDALKNKQIQKSLGSFKKSFQMTPNLIKNCFQKCKTFLKHQQQQLKLNFTTSYHSKCIFYVKLQFSSLYKMYEKTKKSSNILAERLCFLIEIYGILMSLKEQEVKDFEEIQDIQNQKKHVQRYKHLLA